MSDILLVLLSAGLYGLAMPPWSVPGAGYVALAPLFLALHGRSVARGALLGLIWGTAAIWAVGWWVPAALSLYYEQPIWFGVAFALAASLVFAGSYGAGFGACAAWVDARLEGAARALVLASLWVAWELARARLLSGDPWLLTGYALVPMAGLRQIADLGGVYALSFLIALGGAALVEAGLASRRERRVAGWVLLLPACAFAAALLYGRARLAEPAPEEPLEVAVAQGNIALGTQWREEFFGMGLDRYLRLSTEAAKRAHPKLIVWPESAVTFFLAEEPTLRQAIGGLARSLDAELIVGGPYRDHRPDGSAAIYNSAFLVDRSGAIRARYDKEHLLPFAEYFPLRTIELLRRRFERAHSFTPGDAGTILSGDFGRAGVAICFEAIFPEIIGSLMSRGPDFLVNLSNDAWLGSGAGPEQHLSMVTLRAVENRTWIVRATTTGISAIVDPTGEIRERSESGRAASLVGAIGRARGSTFYQRWGDAFAVACAGLGAAAMAGLALRSRSSTSRTMA